MKINKFDILPLITKKTLQIEEVIESKQRKYISPLTNRQLKFLDAFNVIIFPEFSDIAIRNIIQGYIDDRIIIPELKKLIRNFSDKIRSQSFANHIKGVKGIVDARLPLSFLIIDPYKNSIIKEYLFLKFGSSINVEFTDPWNIKIFDKKFSSVIVFDTLNKIKIDDREEFIKNVRRLSKLSVIFYEPMADNIFLSMVADVRRRLEYGDKYLKSEFRFMREAEIMNYMTKPANVEVDYSSVYMRTFVVS